MGSATQRKGKPRILLDTNVLLSAIIFGGAPREILSLVLKNKIKTVTSLILLAEFYEILNKKFPDHEQISAILEKRLKEHFKIVKPKKQIRVCRDKEDNHVLEAAVEGKCDYIITGDKDLLTLKKYKKILIVTPSEFLAS